jgi:Arm DNA-binding domain
MAARARIGLRQVRALQPGQTLWDSSLAGFGARRQQGETIAYVLKYRTSEGRQRWFTIGQHGAPWTPESARRQARQLLGDVARKADPAAEKRAARKAQTVSELCDLYFADATAGRLMTRRRSSKKGSTLATDFGRIERHIKPLLGRRTVGAVTREDVEAFMHDIAAGKTASRTKTKPDSLAFAEAEALLPVPWGYWALFLPMRCDTECALITLCMALRGLQMASVSDALVTMSTKPLVTHCVRRIPKMFGPLLLRCPASLPSPVGGAVKR